MEEKTAETNSPAISLPKGGGAIQGIGETFQPNLFTGTGNFNIPIFTSPGRDGFGPQLSLQYSTGNGNGIFGLGWSLSIPRITRKTEKGLPRYNKKDVFVMSGAEDLVPKLKDSDPQNIDFEIIPSGSGADAAKFRITRYVPRTEGLFARIESWEKLDPNDDRDDSDPNHQVVDFFWRVTTKENMTSIYGRTTGARITDPDNETKIFEWLLEETFDSKGNHISYEYARDDPQLQINELYEQNRRYAQVYPRRILYGNVSSQLTDFDSNQFSAGVPGQGTDHRDPFKRINRHYIYEVIFDYGDWKPPQNHGDQFIYHAAGPTQEYLTGSVPVRGDAFSSFRPGFELRTMRRCSNVLMIHHFRELGGPTLVKSTDFEYTDSTGTKVSLLTRATITGYTQSNNAGYIFDSMPPVAFKYSEFRPNEKRYQTVKANDGNLPAVSLNDPNTALVDVFGNGLQDIVQTTPAGFRYWRNRGNAELDSPHSFHESPAGLALADAGVSFGDMGGDGLADLIVNTGPVRGFFELQAEHEVDGDLVGGWSPESFRHYDDQPSIGLSDPNLRMLDLTGDGLTDLLITTDRHFQWYQSKGEEGYEQHAAEIKSNGLENIFFNDPSGRVRLADMSGDGLKDIVLIHNGRIDYWPNLGYGRFGKRLTMSGDTRLPLNFNPKRLFLADLDGSGTADLIYVDFNEVHFWFNQSGNSWSEKQTIPGTPITIDAASLAFTDFFGTGTTCLLWSYDFGTFADGNYKVLDFCGKNKPYLLTEMSNNLGASTRVRYASSAKFYLEDIAQGNFWATPLPFPVQVVEKTESIDHISKTKLVTCYKYHHGYYDGREREFRGFGRVDQIDTESFDTFVQGDLHGSIAFINNAASYHVPPVETRTWFHTGAYYKHRDIQERYRSEYLNGVERLTPDQQATDPHAFDLGDHQFEISSDAPVTEAYRGLRGSILRTEVYAHDNSADKNFPYQVIEQSYRVQSKQDKGLNTHAVFLTTPKDTVSYHYERKHNGRTLIDPRIQHQLVMEIDDLGNVMQSADIAYKRRQANYAEQEKDLVSITYQDYGNPFATQSDFRHSMPVSTRQFELTGANRSAGNAFTIASLASALSNAQEIAYQDKATFGQIQIRKLSHQIALYWKDDLSDSAAIGVVGFHGLPYEIYQLALTPGLRESIYGPNRLAQAMGVEGGYRTKSGDKWLVADAGDWWIPSGTQQFEPAQFYLPIETTDPFGQKTEMTYDPYHLFPSRIKDPLGNIQEGLIDYRTLQPYLTRDINGNHTEIAFSALGLVVGTAVMGKAGRNSAQSLLGIDNNAINQMRSHTEADSLQGFERDLSDSHAYMVNPDGTNQPPAYSANAIRQPLNKATTRILYDFHRYQGDGDPAGVCVISREMHDKQAGNNLAPLQFAYQLAYSYSDGFGREIQQKVQAEPDTLNNQPIESIKRRWVTSGWTIFNNKGKPVQQYEPFFSDELHYQPDNPIEEKRVSSTLFYDPLQRVICTLHPNQSFEKVVFNPWQQTTWDANDTVLLHPAIDPDVKGYVAKFITSQSKYKTWISQRIPDPANPPTNIDSQQRAALRTVEHANTPTVVHLDVLGNIFLTVADNKTEQLETRSEYDIQSHDLSITDPRGIKAFNHHFDMLGRKLFINSTDAGAKRLFPGVDNMPLYHWDGNGNRVNIQYDELRRAHQTSVQNSNKVTFISEKILYGESKPQAETTNSRGTAWKLYDGAGLAVTGKMDFKGNVLESHRKLLADGTLTEVHWPADAAGDFDEALATSLLEPATRLNSDNYQSTMRYDALNRIISMTLPDGTIQFPSYNPASLLESVSVQHPNQNVALFVKNINYNSKGQREFIEYGNGVTTQYDYEPDTFRLKSIDSTRNSSPKILQQLSYAYDPVGNITSIRDNAQAILFNHNQQIDPESRYTYDAVYRLIEATGREHESMTACQHQTNGKKHTEFLRLPQSSANAQALINYREKYQYDTSGNIERIEHRNSLRTSIRNQSYDAQSNRITTSNAGCANEGLLIPHDANGNITQLPHLPRMEWDYENQLIEVDLNVGVNPNRAYYQYDGQGQRIRKTIVKNNGTDIAERIYLGGYEIYTETVADNLQKQRDTIHVNDDQSRIALIELEKDAASPTQVTNKTIRYQLNNHLTSSSLELDELAQTISYEEYYPYGGTAYMAGRSQTETSLKCYRYSAKERDDETGMYYYGARYYAPWMDRWISADPTSIADDLNLFTYVSNNPLRFIDPTGMKKGSPTITADQLAGIILTPGEQDGQSEFIPIDSSNSESPNPAEVQLDLARLIDVHPQYARQLLAEAALETAKGKVANDKASYIKGGKTRTETTGRTYGSGRYKCTHLVMNSSYEVGLEPVTQQDVGRKSKGYVPTETTLQNLSTLEKAGVVGIVYDTKTQGKPSTSAEFKKISDAIKQGDILLWGAPSSDSLGHHMIIESAEHDAKEPMLYLNVTEAGSYVRSGARREFTPTWEGNKSPSDAAIYRLVRINKEKVLGAYDSNSVFRETLNNLALQHYEKLKPNQP